MTIAPAHPRRFEIAAWCIGAILALGLGVNVHYRAMRSPEARSDFIVFHAAGRAILDHQDAYAVAHERGWPFVYPPPAAVLFVVLAWLPLGVAVVVWYGLSVAAVIWAAFRLARWCGQLCGRPAGWLVVAAFVANAGPIVSGIQRGQISALLLAIAVEAAWNHARGKDARCGAWIAAGALLKVYPALLLLVPLLRGSWRAMLAFAAAVVILGAALPAVTMGPDAARDAWKHWAGAIALPAAGDANLAAADTFGSIDPYSRSNQSLFAVAARWLAREEIPPDRPNIALANWPVERVRLLSQGVALALLSASAGAIWIARRAHGWPLALAWCVPMILMIIIPPIGWHHYFIALTVAYALVAARAATIIPRPPFGLALTLWLALATNWLHFASYGARNAGVLLAGTLALLVAVLIAMRADAKAAIAFASNTRGGVA